MRVATVDGLVTLYYDGSKELYNKELRDELAQLIKTLDLGRSTMNSSIRMPLPMGK